MIVDPSSDRPLYKQLADIIRSQIKSGEFRPGQRLPAQKDYMQVHELSRDTVERAMTVLRNEGLITTERKGSRVRHLAELTILTLCEGRISAHVPTEPERKKHGIKEGIAILVIQRDGQEDQIYPADKFEILVERSAQLSKITECHGR
jgi:DNA-binding transcriptional regulator YhcF (GntR family)